MICAHAPVLAHWLFALVRGRSKGKTEGERDCAQDDRAEALKSLTDDVHCKMSFAAVHGEWAQNNQYARQHLRGQCAHSRPHEQY